MVDKALEVEFLCYNSSEIYAWVNHAEQIDPNRAMDAYQDRVDGLWDEWINHNTGRLAEKLHSHHTRHLAAMWRVWRMRSEPGDADSNKLSHNVRGHRLRAPLHRTLPYRSPYASPDRSRPRSSPPIPENNEPMRYNRVGSVSSSRHRDRGDTDRHTDSVESKMEER